MEAEDKHLFASQWNDSDLVLVVQEKELNVHRWILTSQSPVFKAMLEGNFQEATKDRITLEEKNYESMVQFLKILYPRCMFAEASTSLDDDNLISILALADEYQCVNVVKQCIEEAGITPENVLQILPYAIKYHQPALPKLFDVLKWSAPTAKLEEILPKLDDNGAKDTSIKMLLAKCRFLESSVVNQHDAMISLMYDSLNFVEQLKKTKDAQTTQSYRKDSSLYSGLLAFRSNTRVPDVDSIQTTDSRCGHTITVEDIKNTNSCVHCREKYKEKFIARIPSCSKKPEESFLKILHEGHDIATAVKEQQ